MTASCCRLCEAPLTNTWQTRDVKSLKPLGIGFCESCGLVQQSQLPTDEDLRIYYAHNYWEDNKSNHQPREKDVLRSGLTAVDRLQFMQRARVKGASALKLLDIGAGGGEFCFVAKQFGFDAMGLEPHRGYAEFARDSYGIQVDTLTIDDVAPQAYDVVTMFHVLEHLAHPRLVMQKAWQALRDNGVLIIEVPNIHQADASPHNIFFKAHLFYYSRHSLTAAASPYFDVLHIEDDHNLFAAFRKKPIVERVVTLPSAAQIQQTRQRMRRKGWLEYLTMGGGWIKPFRRIGKLIQEARVKGIQPVQILSSVARRARRDAVGKVLAPAGAFTLAGALESLDAWMLVLMPMALV